MTIGGARDQARSQIGKEAADALWVNRGELGMRAPLSPSFIGA